MQTPISMRTTYLHFYLIVFSFGLTTQLASFSNLDIMGQLTHYGFDILLEDISEQPKRWVPQSNILTFVSNDYMKYRRTKNQSYLLNSCPYALKALIKSDGSMRVRIYTGIDDDGYIDKESFRTNDYFYQENLNGYFFKCNKNSNSGLLGHNHTNGGFDWIQVSEFGDVLYWKYCGSAQNIHHFTPSEIDSFLR